MNDGEVVFAEALAAQIEAALHELAAETNRGPIFALRFDPETVGLAARAAAAVFLAFDRGVRDEKAEAERAAVEPEEAREVGRIIAERPDVETAAAVLANLVVRGYTITGTPPQKNSMPNDNAV